MLEKARFDVVVKQGLIPHVGTPRLLATWGYRQCLGPLQRHY